MWPVETLECRKSRFDYAPIEIFEESVDISSFSCGAIVENVGVFPYIEREDNREGYEMPLVLLAGKSTQELLSLRVPIEYRPARAPHIADCLHVLHQMLRLVVLLLDSFRESATYGERSRTPFELREIELMQPHAAEFERASTDELGERMRMLLAVLCVLGKHRGYRIKILDIAFVEPDVLLDRFLRDALERRNIEFFCFVHSENSIPHS